MYFAIDMGFVLKIYLFRQNLSLQELFSRVAPMPTFLPIPILERKLSAIGYLSLKMNNNSKCRLFNIIYFLCTVLYKNILIESVILIS